MTFIYLKIKFMYWRRHDNNERVGHWIWIIDLYKPGSSEDAGWQSQTVSGHNWVFWLCVHFSKTHDSVRKSSSALVQQLTKITLLPNLINSHPRLNRPQRFIQGVPKNPDINTITVYSIRNNKEFKKNT